MKFNLCLGDEGSAVSIETVKTHTCAPVLECATGHDTIKLTDNTAADTVDETIDTDSTVTSQDQINTL